MGDLKYFMNVSRTRKALFVDRLIPFVMDP